FVMSDSEDSTVTYTEVSSPFEDLSDIGSLGVDGLPMMPEDPYAYVEAALQAPLSPDYMPGPEHPPSPIYVPYVPEPAYLEFMPPKDDVLPDEKQPLPAAVSPTADSPGYIIESDPEEDPEEDDEDPEEDPANYPDDKDDDEEEEESSGDDADDKEEDEEEEEHLAPTDSVPPPTCHTTAKMSTRDQTPIPFPSTTEVNRFLAISTPPTSPLTSYSSLLPHILSPPLPVSSPLRVSPPPLPASPTYPLGYRVAMIRLRAESPSTSHPLPLPSPIILLHTRASVAMMRAVVPSTYILASRLETPPSGTPPLLPIPLPTPLPLLLLPSTDCRTGVSEVTLPPQKRLCITLGLRFEVGKSSSAPTARPTREFRRDYGFVATLDDEIRRDLERDVSYGITTTWDEMVENMQGTPAVTDVAKLDDAQDDISLMSGQLNMLHRDRLAHARTARLRESESRLSREAWVQSMDASDTTRSEVRALWTTVLAQQTEIRDLQAIDRRRQTQLTKALTLLRTLQTLMAVL
ncbi:hypothetical protein Tco_1395276, partial [Tanacetum coccineum]